jgi:hypothetical protein
MKDLRREGGSGSLRPVPLYSTQEKAIGQCPACALSRRPTEALPQVCSALQVDVESTVLQLQLAGRCVVSISTEYLHSAFLFSTAPVALPQNFRKSIGTAAILTEGLFPFTLNFHPPPHHTRIRTSSGSQRHFLDYC